MKEPEKTSFPLMEGVVLKGVGSFYTVRDGEGNLHTLRCMKKVRRERLSPLAGDTGRNMAGWRRFFPGRRCASGRRWPM